MDKKVFSEMWCMVCFYFTSNLDASLVQVTA